MKQFISKFLSQSTKNRFHKVRSQLACFRYGHPSSRIKVIGVTGTKGKTTVCSIIASILDQAGIKNSMETTISTKIGDKVMPHVSKVAWVTTPPANVIQKFLRESVEAKCEYAIMEVTSQAIDQHRIEGIKFDTMVFTNLAPEHIEYHGSKENYINAKLKFFKDNPQAKSVVNMDDPLWNKFYSLSASEKFLYSIKKPIEHGAVARKILSSSNGTTYTVAFDDGQVTVNSALPGVFNIQNALAAFCVGISLSIKPEVIKKGIESIDLVPGRMEPIRVSRNQDFTVIVDYAHTPDSLKNVYETIKEGLKNTGGRLITVLGATGRRDKSKRPLMGSIAGYYADLVVFTDEDPYDENPEEIMEAVAAGIHQGGQKKHQWHLNRNYWKVLNRAQAIHKAIKEASKNDVVVITGKGAEEVMAVGPIGTDSFVPFSDRKIAREELVKRFLK